MPGILQTIKDRARSQRQRIVLPEGGDERIVRAATLIASEGIADVTLLGNWMSTPAVSPLWEHLTGDGNISTSNAAVAAL